MTLLCSHQFVPANSCWCVYQEIIKNYYPNFDGHLRITQMLEKVKLMLNYFCTNQTQMATLEKVKLMLYFQPHDLEALLKG